MCSGSLFFPSFSLVHSFIHPSTSHNFHCESSTVFSSAQYILLLSIAVVVSWVILLFSFVLAHEKLFCSRKRNKKKFFSFIDIFGSWIFVVQMPKSMGSAFISALRCYSWIEGGFFCLLLWNAAIEWKKNTERVLWYVE